MIVIWRTFCILKNHTHLNVNFQRTCSSVCVMIYRNNSGLNLETQYRRPILESNIVSTPVILRQRIYLKTTELFTAKEKR